MRLSALSALLCTAGLLGSEDVTYTITTVAGGTECGDGGAALAAPLGAPEGLAVDAGGNLYIADAIDHRVRKVTPEGVITTVAGNGHKGFRGDGGPALEAQLNSPYGLAVDLSGNLYIADLGNGRVRKVSTDGVIRTVAGGGANAPAIEGGEAVEARLNAPRNLALDAEGNLYLSDFGDHRVYRVSPLGLIWRVAGVGWAGSIEDGETTEAVRAPLWAPAGLVVDHTGTLYVADSGNLRIRKIQRGWMSTVPVGRSPLRLPTGLALDARGNVYVADKGGGMVLRVTPGWVTPYNSGWTSKILNQPRDIAFDAAGNLYVADALPDGKYWMGVVWKVTAVAPVSTVAGGLTYRPPGDGGPATAAHLDTPSGIALDGAGNLYIADRNSNRVRKVDSSGAIQTIAGRGGAESSGDGGSADQAGLNQPDGLAADASGNVWIAEYAAHRVRRVRPDGLIGTVAGGSELPGYAGDGQPAVAAALNFPEGVAVDGAGNLYIADTFNHVIRKVGRDGIIRTVVGKEAPGYAGDGGPETWALLQNPTGVCLDGQGNLYIADSRNHVVLKAAAGAIWIVAGTGVAWFGGDGGPATAAQLQLPNRVAADRAGNLYIADTGNHRIRKVTPDGMIATIAGDGTPGYGGDGGPALQAQLNEPADVAVDAAGNVFVADRANDLVRKLAPSAARVPIVPVEANDLVNAASMQPGPVAPGEIATLLGAGLGPEVALEAQMKEPGLLDTSLGDVQVLFDGQAAALLRVQFSQISLQVPYEIAGRSNSEIEVRQAGVVKARMVVAVVEAAPAIFTTGNGKGQAAALNQDGTSNSLASPAPPGTIVTLYATGVGQTRPPGVTGRLAADPGPEPALPVTVRIGGEDAEILFARSAPGYAGLMQINARVPAALGKGYQTVHLLAGGAKSQPGVVIAVR